MSRCTSLRTISPIGVQVVMPFPPAGKMLASLVDGKLKRCAENQWQVRP